MFKKKKKKKVQTTTKVHYDKEKNVHENKGFLECAKM